MKLPATYRRQHGTGGMGVRRRRHAVAVLPTLFTLGNCLCGFASLHYAARGMREQVAGQFPTNYSIAGYLIFGAMLFDMLDGRMARLAKATSAFGKELDSLADMVSFGAAPAFLTLQLIGDLLLQGTKQPPGPYELLGPGADSTMGKLIWIIGAIYVACTALRLAKYNVMPSQDGFSGLPSPGAAAVVAASVLFFETLNSSQHVFYWSALGAGAKEGLTAAFPYVMPGVLLAAGLLMVSRFRYTHVANRYLRGRRSFRYVVRLVVVLGLLMWQPQIAAVTIIYMYAASGVVAWGWRRLFRRGEPALVAKMEAQAEEEGE